MADPGVGLRLRVPCKINLSLEVLGKRADGYHDIRSVMQAVSLCDELHMRSRAGGEINLRCSDPSLPVGPQNLVHRAARLLRQATGTDRGVDLHLEKRIPVGGGLGGGSADAALTLCGLRRLWGVDLEDAALAELAAELGSDVPFFLRGGTALCRGRGERVAPVGDVPIVHYVLITPPLSVSTPRVYGAVGAAGQGASLTGGDNISTKVIDALSKGNLDELGRSLHNDLQRPALARYAELEEIWSALQEMKQRCTLHGVLLSGSGASFFAVARGQAHAARAARQLQHALDVPCVPVQSLPPWDYRCSLLTSGRDLL